MFTKEDYVSYLISSIKNFTCTNLSSHSDNVTHDRVSDFLSKATLDSSHLWNMSKNLLDDSEESVIILDDSVLNKKYSKKIALVKKQYSGNEGGLVNGICMVNLLHCSKDGDHHPIDYRIYNPSVDHLSKHDHFEMMFEDLKSKGLKTKTILFDSWYGSVKNLKLIHRSAWRFFTVLKKNRRVSLSKELGYQSLDSLPDELFTQEGIWIKLKALPFKVRLFKVVSKNGDIEWLITNCEDESTILKEAIAKNKLRWNIETFHRSFIPRRK